MKPCRARECYKLNTNPPYCRRLLLVLTATYDVRNRLYLSGGARTGNDVEE
jgi:hypothetical protein